MGHSEMLLAVAGLKADEIKQRTGKLATGDWSDFSPAEATAFVFAHKLAKEPTRVADQDIKGLVETFGAPRAVDVLWYSALVQLYDASGRRVPAAAGAGQCLRHRDEIPQP